MDKLSKFNQWVLSIIGVGFILFCLFGGVVVLRDVLGCNRTTRPSSGTIVSPEQAQQFAADSIRKQVVSLKTLFVLDSTRQQFLIPVGVADLENIERSDDGLLNKTREYSKYGAVDNPSSNLLFYEGLSGSVRPLFDSRVSISSFEFHSKSTGQPVLIFFSDSDSNKDKVLNSQDLEKMAVWMPTWARPKTFELPNQTVLSTLRTTRDHAILQVGEDRDKDGKFEQGREPIVFYRVNFNCAEPSCLEFRQVVPDAVLQDLQRVLDGF